MVKKLDLAIFSKAPADYAPVRFKEESQKMGLEAEIISYPRLDFEIREEGTTPLWQREPLPTSKIVIFRAAGGDGYYIPQRDFLLGWYEDHGAYVLNRDTYLRWSRLDKVAQHFELQKAHLPFIESLNFGSNRKLLEWAETQKEPYIIKHNLSSQGRDVIKVVRKRKLERILNSGLYRARTLLVQKFLRAGEDLRIIVIGGKVLGAMKRTAQKGKYLTNYSVGGKVERYDINKDITAKAIAERTAEYFSLEYVGVDLMKDEAGKWRILEINRACQFEGFEKSTGINVAESVIKYLLRKSK